VPPQYDYTEHLEEQAETPEDWARALTKRPTPFRFWYRESPRPLVPWRRDHRVRFRDPPVRISGMTNLVLDAEGRLEFLLRIPPQKDETPGPDPAPDWARVFAAAGLEADDFSEVPPVWVPESYCGERIAWKGTCPGQPEPELLVEACSYRGRPVYFDVVQPWVRPWRMQVYEPKPAERVGAILFGVWTSLGSENLRINLSLTVLGTGVVVYCLIRFGFLAGMASLLLANFPGHFTVPAQMGAWYARPSWIAVAIVGALLVYAFYASLGGRSLIRPEALDWEGPRSFELDDTDREVSRARTRPDSSTGRVAQADPQRP
jgi:hypothetical protein